MHLGNVVTMLEEWRKTAIAHNIQPEQPIWLAFRSLLLWFQKANYFTNVFILRVYSIKGRKQETMMARYGFKIKFTVE
jgi:hypothetical protein